MSPMTASSADRVVLVNNATLGGHVEIGEHAILGGLAAIQQHCRVGAHAFIGGLSGREQRRHPLRLGHRRTGGTRRARMSSA